MRLAILGRTESLLATAELALQRGHEIPLIWTNRAEPFYLADESDFEALARRCGAIFRSDLLINEPESIETLSALNCDAALSINFITLLRASALDRFRLGVLNAHAGDLPRYRGNACPNWAILNAESHIAICIHLMTEVLDAGPVVLKSCMPIDDGCYIEDIYDWIRDITPGLLIRAVERLDDGTLQPHPQPLEPEHILRTFPRRPEDGRLDWQWETERVLRLVRASSRPFAGAFCFLEGERRVTIWRADRYAYPFRFLAVPGQVCLRDGVYPVVACSDGMIRLTDVEIDCSIRGTDAMNVIASSLRNRLT